MKNNDFVKYFILFLFIFFINIEGLISQNTSGENLIHKKEKRKVLKINDSGGKLSPEQAAYDVTFYGLNLRINIEDSTISGYVNIRSTLISSLSDFVLNLNSIYIVDSVTLINSMQKLPSTHIAGKINIKLPKYNPGTKLSLNVYYHGKPPKAKDAPWDNGFTWKKTNDSKPFIGVTCETEGGDCWWPCKDHPSDEPDNAEINMTVPSDLSCVSNGSLKNIVDNADGTKTFQWFVSNPINNYCVTFYIGPYVRIPVDYTSITGEKIPAEYWFLPQSVDKAKQNIPKFLNELRFLEDICGPFPFRADKYAIAEAPYFGMEHQTIIAYGNNFAPSFYGFDYIHLHETAHEWWGNLVTAKDWSDVWIHEGFASYIESLFIERYSGKAAYKNYMQIQKNAIRNTIPVAPYNPVTASKIFETSDIYNKGSWVLHTLRYYLGDETFFTLFRKFAYPDSTMEKITDGRQCRLATTDEFLQIAESVTGRKLDWFFNVYLRQEALPILSAIKNEKVLNLKWITQNNIPFYLPVEVQIGNSFVRVEMPDGSGSIHLAGNENIIIDPEKRILMANTSLDIDSRKSEMPLEFDMNIYPNPANPATNAWIDVPYPMRIRGNLYTITGAKVTEALNEFYQPGKYNVPIDLSKFSSGVYFLKIEGDKKILNKKIVLIR